MTNTFVLPDQQQPYSAETMLNAIEVRNADINNLHQNSPSIHDIEALPIGGDNSAMLQNIQPEAKVMNTSKSPVAILEDILMGPPTNFNDQGADISEFLH